VDANTVIAICSVVIAVASLAVAAYVAWATRKHWSTSGPQVRNVWDYQLHLDQMTQLWWLI
jgi:hypothetical protein